MFFVVGWLVIMLITALVANSKNRSPLAWALLAIPLGLIATVVLACSSKLPAGEQTTMPTPANSIKTCPRCAETVKAAAQVCRFCQHEFSAPSAMAATNLPWTLQEDWGDGFGIYGYKGQRLAYNKSGVKWQTRTFDSPKVAVASIDAYLQN
ncbi:zinc ribbon domain-containing protein [Paraburkholderia sp. BCC1884]|uniref:zinc ribbon domain-containing protein n=1 Tax=Paraburkholderia sp. BCC1884 TaxID=2562668 RepID=UPI00118417EE|nr:zinc ribbon domain-containing protein [Paraburkholderia sp. BCC1884]